MRIALVRRYVVFRGTSVGRDTQRKVLRLCNDLACRHTCPARVDVVHSSGVVVMRAVF